VDAVRTILVPPKARIVRVRPCSADLELIARLVDEGRIVPIVEHVFPLDRIVEAEEQAGSKHTRGKVVVTRNAVVKHRDT
jgi:NADPH:quinone reductase-like Zn-dependent oxidoreductase